MVDAALQRLVPDVDVAGRGEEVLLQGGVALAAVQVPGPELVVVG